jgi:hypothetical protein
MNPRKQREVRLTNPMLSGMRIIMIVFAVFFALAGFGARYLQKANDENAWRLANEGVTGLATITRKHIDTSSSTNRNASGLKRYILEYSFPLAGSDKEWHGDDEVTEDEYDTVMIGDQFDVRYWPQDPDIATILTDSYSAGAKLAKTISTVLFGLAALLVLILLIWPVRTALDRKKLSGRL